MHNSRRVLVLDLDHTLAHFGPISQTTYFAWDIFVCVGDRLVKPGGELLVQHTCWRPDIVDIAKSIATLRCSGMVEKVVIFTNRYDPDGPRFSFTQFLLDGLASVLGFRLEDALITAERAHDGTAPKSLDRVRRALGLPDDDSVQVIAVDDNPQLLTHARTTDIVIPAEPYFRVHEASIEDDMVVKTVMGMDACLTEEDLAEEGFTREAFTDFAIQAWSKALERDRTPSRPRPAKPWLPAVMAALGVAPPRRVLVLDLDHTLAHFGPISRPVQAAWSVFVSCVGDALVKPAGELLVRHMCWRPDIVAIAESISDLRRSGAVEKVVIFTNRYAPAPARFSFTQFLLDGLASVLGFRLEDAIITAESAHDGKEKKSLDRVRRELGLPDDGSVQIIAVDDNPQLYTHTYMTDSIIRAEPYYNASQTSVDVAVSMVLGMDACLTEEDLEEEGYTRKAFTSTAIKTWSDALARDRSRVPSGYQPAKSWMPAVMSALGLAPALDGARLSITAVGRGGGDHDDDGDGSECTGRCSHLGDDVSDWYSDDGYDVEVPLADDASSSSTPKPVVATDPAVNVQDAGSTSQSCSLRA